MNWCVTFLCVCFYGSANGLWLQRQFPLRRNQIEDINLRYYTGSTVQEYIDIPLYQTMTLLDQTKFNKNHTTVIYIHGYTEHSQKESTLVLMRAYLETQPNVNVVLLDWANMSYGLYLLNAAPNTKKVGEAVANQLNNLINNGLSLDGIHILGHSLGCHVAGYIARDLRYKYNKTIKRVTALDPAYPGFYRSTIFRQHLQATDAEFVDVIHTDAGIFGTPVSTGTADFWPNGGKMQPGCPLYYIFQNKDDNCSHARSWRFYAESVRNPQAFPVSPTIDRNNTVFMGLNCDTNARGSYFLTTNAQEPFGKGMAGI